MYQSSTSHTATMIILAVLINKKQYPNALVYAPIDDIMLLDPAYGIQPIKEKNTC